MNPGLGIEGKERAVTSRYPMGFMSYYYIVTGVKKILFRRNLLSLLAKWEGIVAKSHRLKHHCIGCNLQYKIFLLRA